MRRSLWAIPVILAAGVAALAWELWPSPPLLLYETVSGWPMRVHYRNRGSEPVYVKAVGAMPALSVDEPLPQATIDQYLATVKAEAKRSPTIVAPGDFMWFVADDPDGLAWEPAKTEHTTWLYVFAVVEMPRTALVNRKWISELCLVSKTKEPFKPCDTHNEVYAGG